MAIPVKEEIFLRTEWRHQEWRCREFMDLARERRRSIWRVWVLLFRDGYGAVGLGGLS